MCQSDRDYAENIRLIDQINAKILKKDFQIHRKTVSQPDFVEVQRQPDRLDLHLNHTVLIQLYPSIFKYIRLRVKDMQKPLQVSYESSNLQSQIKIFVSSTNDSPNILNYNLQVINRNRFQFSDQSLQVTRFQCDYVYISIYSDKYTELKLKAACGLAQLPVVKHQKFTKEILLKEPGSYSRRGNRSDHKTRSNNSFIKSNKESQVKFRLLVDERLQTQRKINSTKFEEALLKKKQLVVQKHHHVIEAAYMTEVNRLQSRVSRLHNEIQQHINNLDAEWLEIIYTCLLAKAIRHRYFRKIMRIVVDNKVQVCCRKFMRIMKAKLNVNYKRVLHIDTNLSLGLAANQIKRKARARAKKIMKDFLFIYCYQSDGIKKLQAFNKKIRQIQERWRNYKAHEHTYIQKSVYLLQQKWYQVYKVLQQELVLQRQAPPTDKQLISEVFREYLGNLKKNFAVQSKLMESLKMRSNLTLFRPLTMTMMKEIMELYLARKNHRKP